MRKRIGTTGYETLRDAVNAVKDGETIDFVTTAYENATVLNTDAYIAFFNTPGTYTLVNGQGAFFNYELEVNGQKNTDKGWYNLVVGGEDDTSWLTLTKMTLRPYSSLTITNSTVDFQAFQSGCSYLSAYGNAVLTITNSTVGNKSAGHTGVENFYGPRMTVYGTATVTNSTLYTGIGQGSEGVDISGNGQLTMTDSTLNMSFMNVGNLWDSTKFIGEEADNTTATVTLSNTTVNNTQYHGDQNGSKTVAIYVGDDAGTHKGNLQVTNGSVIDLTKSGSNILHDIEVNTGSTMTIDSSTVKAANFTNSGTVNVTGTSKLSATSYSGTINVGSTEKATTLTTDGLTVTDGDLIVKDGSTVTLSGNGFDLLTWEKYIVDSASKYNENAHEGYTLNIQDADLFKVHAIYANGGSAVTVTDVKKLDSMYLNIYGGVMTLSNSTAEDETTNVTGTLNVTNGAVLDTDIFNINKGLDGMQAGVVNVTNATVTVNSSFNLSTGTRDTKYYIAGADQTAKMNLSGATLNVKCDPLSNAGILTIAAASTVTAAAVANTGSISITDSTLTVTGTVTNSCAIAMDADSTITAAAIANTGSITVDMTGSTGVRYKLVDYTGAGTMTLASYGTVTLTSTDDSSYNLWISDNDLYAVNAALSIETIVVDDDWAGSDFGDAVEVGGESYYYGINAFADTAAALAGANATTTDVQYNAGSYVGKYFANNLDITFLGDATMTGAFGAYTTDAAGTENDVKGAALSTEYLSLAGKATMNVYNDITVTGPAGNPADASAWIRANTVLNIKDGGSVVGLTQLSNRGVINVEEGGELGLTWASGSGTNALAGTAGTAGTVNVYGTVTAVDGTVVNPDHPDIKQPQLTIAEGDGYAADAISKVNVVGGSFDAATSTLTIGDKGQLNLTEQATAELNIISNNGAITANLSSLTVNDALTNTATVTATDATITAENLTNSGTFSATDSTVTVNDTLTNTATFTATDATITAGNLTNSGTFSATGSTITVNGTLSNTGTFTMDETSRLVLATSEWTGVITVDATGATASYAVVTTTGDAFDAADIAKLSLKNITGYAFALTGDHRTISLLKEGDIPVTPDDPDDPDDETYINTQDSGFISNDLTNGTKNVVIDNQGTELDVLSDIGTSEDATIINSDQASVTENDETINLRNITAENVSIIHEGGNDLDVNAENITATGSVLIENMTKDSDLTATVNIQSAETLTIQNETNNELSHNGTLNAKDVNIINNSTTAAAKTGEIAIANAITATGDIHITNGSTNEDAAGRIAMGEGTHTAQGGLTITNATNNVINGSGSAADDNETAVNFAVYGNVAITNNGHINANISSSNGSITITNTSPDTLIGDFTGTSVDVENTAEGAVNGTELNASSGDITLKNDGTIDTITLTTLADKKVAISYTGDAAPATITKATVTTGDLYLGGESMVMVDGDVTNVHLGKDGATSATDVAGGVFTWNGGTVDAITGSLNTVHGSAVINVADAIDDVAISGLDKVTAIGALSFGDKQYRMDTLALADADTTLTWDKTGGDQDNIGTAASATGRVAVTGGGTIVFAQTDEYALQDLDLEAFAGNVDVNAGTLNLAYANALKTAADIDVAEGATLKITADQVFNTAIDNDGTLTLGNANVTFRDLDTASGFTVAAGKTVGFTGNNVFGGDLVNNGTVTFDKEKTTTLNGTAKLVNNGAAQTLAGKLVVNHTDVTYTAGTVYDTIATGDWGFTKGETAITVGTYGTATLGGSFTAGGRKLWFGSNNGGTGITDDTITLSDSVTADYKNFKTSDDIRATYTNFDGTIQASGTFSGSIYGEYGTLDLTGAVTAKYVFGGTLGDANGSKTLAVDQAVTAVGIFGRDQFLTTYFAPKGGFKQTATTTTSVDVTAKTTVTYLAGGNLMNGNGKFVYSSNTTNLTVTDAAADTTATLVTGGSIIGGRTKLTENNAITMNLAVGTYTYVAGAGYLQRNTATLTHTGDISINITGGSYTYVYGGAAAREPQYTIKASIAGDISITVDTSANAVSLGYLFGGNSGKDHGQIKGDTTITFKGDGSKLDFSLATADDGLGGVCGGSAVKSSHSEPTEGKTRTLAFDAFTGDFTAPVIESFETIKLTNGSDVTFTSSDLALAEVSTWELAENTTLTWAKGYENSFDGDTLNFGAGARIVSTAAGDELFADLLSAKSVTLAGETAAWDVTAGCWASASYKLSYDKTQHTLAVGTLA